MLILDTPTKTLELRLANNVSNSQLHIVTTYEHRLSSSPFYSYPKTSQTESNNTSVVILVSPPEGDYVKIISQILVFNADSANSTVLIQMRDDSIVSTLFSIELEPNKTSLYSG